MTKRIENRKRNSKKAKHRIYIEPALSVKKEIFSDYLHGVKVKDIARKYNIPLKKVFQYAMDYFKYAITFTGAGFEIDYRKFIMITHKQKGIISDNVASKYLHWYKPKYKKYRVLTIDYMDVSELYGEDYASSNYIPFVLEALE